MSHSRLFGAAVLCTALLTISTAASAVNSYTITDLGDLGGTSSYAYGINNNGQVVGEARTTGNAATHAFRYSNGAMIDLGTPWGGTNSRAFGINNYGTAVGESQYFGDAATYLSLYNCYCQYGAGPGNSAAYDINDGGQVVGYYTTASGLHAFLKGSVYATGYEPGYVPWTDLGTLGGAHSVAYGINNNGAVVGQSNTTGNAAQHAFIYSNGGMTDLGTLGGTNSIAHAINDMGQVVGYANPVGTTANHAFFFSGGIMTDLGTLGGTNSVAQDINLIGQVVGYAQTNGNAAQHAFIYNNGSMTDLNYLLDPDSGWDLVNATAINDSGQIAGYGTINGQTHAYLMTPTSVVPVPAAVWLFGSGLLGLIGMARRRRKN